MSLKTKTASAMREDTVLEISYFSTTFLPNIYLSKDSNLESSSLTGDTIICQDSYLTRKLFQILNWEQVPHLADHKHWKRDGTDTAMWGQNKKDYMLQNRLLKNTKTQEKKNRDTFFLQRTFQLYSSDRITITFDFLNWQSITGLLDTVSNQYRKHDQPEGPELKHKISPSIWNRG